MRVCVIGGGAFWESGKMREYSWREPRDGELLIQDGPIVEDEKVKKMRMWRSELADELAKVISL
ncbi:hypothetical protein COLO4_16107 [Corchorus olitorius]|uniref:Uncharacterized protein n=1 Tax=Corchorus olitorius TaxID=93759 RepID=A0A1R3JJP3_9ROSI|nr:hypothetical protein COLO4_16107 [Corchorus olitorius]